MTPGEAILLRLFVANSQRVCTLAGETAGVKLQLFDTITDVAAAVCENKLLTPLQSEGALMDGG